jgi:hypothetical protein
MKFNLLQKLLLLFIFFINISFSQDLVDVTNLNIKLSLEQTADHYYTFDEGDEIIINYNMVKGRHMKLFEVTALPSNIKLTEFKAKKLENRKIKVAKKGVYRFRVFSSSITNRVCNLRIQRKPAHENNVDFNTDWTWKVVRDSIYVPYQKDSLVGYKTVKYLETIKELKETKLEEIMLFEKSEKVHSYYNENISRSYLKVDLPQLINTNLKEEQLIAWSYWISVGQEGQEAYKENFKSISNLLGKTSNAYFKTPLAGIAIGELSKLITPQTGEDVEYYFIRDFENVKQFMNKQQFYLFDKGKGRAAYGRNDKIREGVFYIGLINDNQIKGIDVDVKILVVKEIKTYENVTYNRERQEPQYITLNKKRLEIKETQFRVPVE